MPRPLIPIVLALAWLAGLACLGVAWGAEHDPASVLTMPGAGGSLALELHDGRGHAPDTSELSAPLSGALLIVPSS